MKMSTFKTRHVRRELSESLKNLCFKHFAAGGIILKSTGGIQPAKQRQIVDVVLYMETKVYSLT